MNTIHSRPPSAPIPLRGSLDLYAAERIQATLTECLAADGPVSIDLGSVDSCDTAGLQLLLAAHATAASHSRPLRFQAVPDAVAECCRRLGVPPLTSIDGRPTP